MPFRAQIPLDGDTAAAGQAVETKVGKPPVDKGMARLAEAKAALARGEINYKGGSVALEREIGGTGSPATAPPPVEGPPPVAGSEPPAEGPRPAVAEGADEGGQPRGPDGKFLSKEGEAADGTPPEGGEGEGAAGASGAAGTEGTEGLGDESQVVEVPGRRPEDPPVKLEFDDKETADAIRRLTKGYRRGAEFERMRTDLDSREAELRQFEDYAQADPIGLVLEYLPAERQTDIAKHLLTIPAVHDAVLDVLRGWDSEDTRRADVAELERDREKMRGDVERELSRKAANRKLVNEVNRNIGVVADLVDDDLSEQFADDAAAAMARFIRAEKKAGRSVNKLTPESYLEAMKSRLRLYGITPEQALAALSGQPPDPSANSTARPQGSAAEQLAAKANGKGVDGRRHVEASKVRKLAAAGTPGSGVAGSSASRPVPPRGQGVAERIAWMREQNPQFAKR